MKEEDKFRTSVIEKLGNTNFIDFKKFQTKLTINEKLNVIKDMLNEKQITGVFVREKLLFFSLNENDLEKIKEELKSNGKVNTELYNHNWNVSHKIISNFYNFIALGYFDLNKKYYYSHSALKSQILDELEVAEEFNIKAFSKKHDTENAIIIDIVKELIQNKEIQGVIVNKETFLELDKVESLLRDYLDKKAQEESELTFSQIAKDIGIDERDLQAVVIKIINSYPTEYTLYPIEERIVFKK